MRFFKEKPWVTPSFRTIINYILIIQLRICLNFSLFAYIQMYLFNCIFYTTFLSLHFPSQFKSNKAVNQITNTFLTNFGLIILELIFSFFFALLRRKLRQWCGWNLPPVGYVKLSTYNLIIHSELHSWISRISFPREMRRKNWC